jgi:hypothetical protein
MKRGAITRLAAYSPMTEGAFLPDIRVAGVLPYLYYLHRGHTFAALPRCGDCLTPIPPKAPFTYALCGQWKVKLDGRRRRQRDRVVCICPDCYKLRCSFKAIYAFDPVIRSPGLFTQAAHDVEQALLEVGEALKGADR